MRAAGAVMVWRPGARVGPVTPSIGRVVARPPLRHQVRMSFRYCSPSPSPRAVAPASYHRPMVCIGT